MKIFTTPPPEAERIIQNIAKTYNITYWDIIGTSRKMSVRQPRQVAMYLLGEKYHGYRTVDIGGWFRRDHATFIHSKNAIINDVKHNKSLRDKILNIGIENGILVNFDNNSYDYTRVRDAHTLRREIPSFLKSIGIAIEESTLKEQIENYINKISK